MNSLANLNIFIEPAIAAVPPPRPQVTSSSFKQEFNKQLETPVKGLDSQSKKAANAPQAAVQETNAQTANKPEVEKNTLSSSEKNEALTQVPLDEELGKFLAALPEEEAKELLNEISQWLSQLNPEELAELLAALETSPEALFSLMPESLQQLVTNLTANNPASMQQLHQLIANLASSSANFQQLAAINYQAAQGNQPASLTLVQTEAAGHQTAEKQTATANIASPQSQPNLTATSSKQDEEPKTQASRKSKSKNQISQLISKLNKASQTAVNRNNAAATASSLTLNGTHQASKEGIHQLLQQASQGLSQNVNSTSQLNAARSMPLMMQAAAKANAQALANRLSIMQAQNMKVAEMRLDPPNLGKVRIQIRMTGEQASVNITAANPQARELLEQALPRLKDMLSEEGIDLADAQVFDEQQDEETAEQKAQEEVQQLAASQGIKGNSIAGLDAVEQEHIYYLTEPLGLVDYYA